MMDVNAPTMVLYMEKGEVLLSSTAATRVPTKRISILYPSISVRNSDWAP